MTENDFQPPMKPAKKPRSLRSLLLMIGLAFVAGISVMAWGLSHWEAGRAWLFGQAAGSAVPAISYTPQVAATAPDALPVHPVTDVSARVTALEARLARVEANGGADGGSFQSEGLLLTFAARRALERGNGLGTLEGLLSQRFEARQPGAIATVIAAGRQPVTLEQLRKGFEAAIPALTGKGTDAGWWQSFTGAMSGLITFRNANEPTTDPAIAVAHAAQLLEQGRVDLAVAAVSRLPDAPKAASWTEAARRYLAADRALDVLEDAAINGGDKVEAPAAVAPPEAAPAPAANVPAPATDGI
jgi:hypothetical protein